jgi:hypothetical protein
MAQPQGTRGSGHARSGPPLRPRRADPSAPPPRHRAPEQGLRAGTRVKPSTSRVPIAVGAAAVSVALVTAVALLAGGDDPRPAATGASARPTAAASTDPTSSAAPSPTASWTASPTAAATGQPQESAAVAAATSAGRTPEAAQAALEQVLAARAAGNTALLRAVLAGDDGAASEASAALNTAGDDLQSVLTAWGGADLAAQVRSGLDRQTAASRAYAEAVRDGDASGADRARADMGSVSRALGATLDPVTGGGIAPYVPPQDAGRLRDFVDALRAGDAAAASEQERWLRARLTREGTALARGLAQQG